MLTIDAPNTVNRYVSIREEIDICVRELLFGFKKSGQSAIVPQRLKRYIREILKEYEANAPIDNQISVGLDENRQLRFWFTIYTGA